MCCVSDLKSLVQDYWYQNETVISTLGKTKKVDERICWTRRG